MSDKHESKIKAHTHIRLKLYGERSHSKSNSIDKQEVSVSCVCHHKSVELNLEYFLYHNYFQAIIKIVDRIAKTAVL
ncbi:MAG: hypothetical protein SWX82_05830 [Cyanobacteriota bacterium]|nr:hypothetical protein [Cyanobacteriota bacterium]